MTLHVASTGGRSVRWGRQVDGLVVAVICRRKTEERSFSISGNIVVHLITLLLLLLSSPAPLTGPFSWLFTLARQPWPFTPWLLDCSLVSASNYPRLLLHRRSGVYASYDVEMEATKGTWGGVFGPWLHVM